MLRDKIKKYNSLSRRSKLVLRRSQPGFTIVELLVVIVVIAILAAIALVAYSGIQKRADESAIASKETQAKKKLELYKVDNSDTYPASQSLFDTLIGQTASDTYYTTYTSPSPHTTYVLSTAKAGANDSNSTHLQTVTAATCPNDRTMKVDARDSRTYWIQKLADGKCWMLTNLAYAGGGTSSYGDTRTLSNGTGDTAATYTEAKYYIPAGSNPTTSSTEPSTSTTGTGQYGYLYNWCAAMGVQVGTNACANASTPAASVSVSICPSGWRLPIGNGSEFQALNAAANGGATTTDAGLRSAWLAQRSGAWYAGFNGQGSAGYYWSSTQHSAAYSYDFGFSATSAIPADAKHKAYAFAVRCIAN